MSKLDDIVFDASHIAIEYKLADRHGPRKAVKEQIKDLMLEIVDETAFAYQDGLAYAKVVRKKVEEL